MARGTALVRDILPVLEEASIEALDGHAAERLRMMLDRYAPVIDRERARLREQADGVAD
jgi:hypothetical protein